jgi:hypothetical protein
VYQVEQHVHAMQRIVHRCKGPWTSMRESFALLDKAVGGTLLGMRIVKVRLATVFLSVLLFHGETQLLGCPPQGLQ